MTPQCMLPLGWPTNATASAVAQSAPLLELQSSPTDFVCLSQITLFVAAGEVNGPYVIGIGKPAAKGVGVGGTLALKEDSGDTSLPPSLMSYMLWTLPPTIPTNFLRRVSMSQQNLGGTLPVIRFPFMRGLILAPSSSLVVWAILPTQSRITLLDMSIELDG